MNRVLYLLIFLFSFSLLSLDAKGKEPRFKPFYRQYRGIMDNSNARLVLHSVRGVNRSEYSLEGSYSRDNATYPFNKGKIDSKGNFSIDTLDGKFLFIGTLQKGTKEVSGNMQSAQDKKSFSFTLKEDYSNNSLRSDYTVVNKLSKDKDCESSLTYPVFEGRGKVTDKINKFIKKSIIGAFKKGMEDRFNVCKKYHNRLREDYNLTIVQNEKDLLSILYQSYRTLGGTPEVENRAYHFDLNTGKDVQLSDLLSGDYKKELEKTKAPDAGDLWDYPFVVENDSLKFFDSRFADNSVSISLKSIQSFLPKDGILYNILNSAAAPPAKDTKEVKEAKDVKTSKEIKETKVSKEVKDKDDEKKKD